ncbi:MAG: hypothetical protein OXU37_03595 [Thaumarchaeota archaeon]|nr:hypothetical protein [Nitrososphaerota archaeon]
MFGDLAVVEVLENFDRCLEAAAMSRLVIAMLPVHNTANREISCADGVPVEERAEGMGLRVIATLELYVNHVLASFGRIGEIDTVYSKGEALVQCSKFLDRHGLRRSAAIPDSKAPLSTSGAARYVADRRVPYISAICSEEDAVHYGVPVVRRNIADSPDNRTKFHAYARADARIPEGFAEAARRAAGGK